MSIDLASFDADLPAGAVKLSAFSPGANATFAFDFDGVVVSPVEDDIYHLPTWEGEEELLSRAEAAFRVPSGGMELKYRRHLIFQAACLLDGRDIPEGPAIAQLEAAARKGKVFILTARSGWYAVERMRLFLKKRGVIPIDVFNVGRVKKDRQLDLICRELSTDPVYYLEDNKAHLAGVSSLTHDHLSLVWVERTEPRKPDDELQADVVGTIERVLRNGI